MDGCLSLGKVTISFSIQFIYMVSIRKSWVIFCWHLCSRIWIVYHLLLLHCENYLLLLLCENYYLWESFGVPHPPLYVNRMRQKLWHTFVQHNVSKWSLGCSLQNADLALQNYVRWRKRREEIKRNVFIHRRIYSNFKKNTVF